MLRHDHPAGALGVHAVATTDPDGLLGEPAQELTAVGDLSRGLGQRLAHLQGHDQRELVLVLLHQVERPPEDLAPLPRRRPGPVRGGFHSGIQGGRTVGYAGVRDGLDDLSGGRVLDVQGGPERRRPPLAADEETVGQSASSADADWSTTLFLLARSCPDPSVAERQTPGERPILTRMASPWKARRVRSATATIFAEMSALAVATQSVNLGQGFPDTDGPGFMLDEARAAIAAGVNQYPPGRGIAPLRQAIAAHDGPALRPELRPRHRDPGHHRSHRGAGRHHSRLRRSRGRGDRARAVLRLVRGLDRAGRRVPGRGRALRTGLPPRPRRAGRGVHPAHQGDPDQLPAQPHGRGPHRGRPRRDRPAGRAARRPGDLRRGLRAPDLRRGRTPSVGRLPRPARAHRTHLLGRQDLLRHRVEDRVGDEHAGADRRDHRGEAVPDLHLRRAVPAGRGPRPERGRRLGRAASGGGCRTSATGWPTACGRSGWSRCSRRAPTSCPPT